MRRIFFSGKGSLNETSLFVRAARTARGIPLGPAIIFRYDSESTTQSSKSSLYPSPARDYITIVSDQMPQWIN